MRPNIRIILASLSVTVVIQSAIILDMSDTIMKLCDVVVEMWSSGKA